MPGETECEGIRSRSRSTCRRRRRIFSGMVGSTSAPYAATLADRNDIRYVGVRHEQTAAAIIEATARLTHGKPGCLMIHGASGLLAASAGIASAALDSTPMLVLSATGTPGNGKRLVADYERAATAVGGPGMADSGRTARPGRRRDPPGIARNRLRVNRA